MRILGQPRSINVRKVLWTCAELGLAPVCEDWGGATRPTSDPAFLALNLKGLVPVLVDGDIVLTESNTICRYLAAREGRSDLLPTDAAACPHLALAAIVHAGVQGIEERLAPPVPTQEDLSLLSREALSARGYVRQPTTLDAALDRFEGSATATGWFPAGFAGVYRAHKAAESAYLEGMDVGQKCAAYEATY